MMKEFEGIIEGLLKPLTLALSHKGRGNKKGVLDYSGSLEGGFFGNLRAGFAHAHAAPYRKSAFTLAEVLITLGIIGVVAAMTMPSLISNYKKQTYVNGLKKAVSTLSNGFRAIMAEEGVTDFGHTSLFNGKGNSDSDRNEDIDTTIKKHFSTIKTCKYGDSSCQIEGYKFLYGSGSTTYFNSSSYKFYTADGMAFTFGGYTSCSSQNGISLCGYVRVDINGPKKPNQIGRDFFYFQIDRDGSLYPYAGQRYAEYYSGDAWKDDGYYWIANADCGVEGSTDVSGFTGVGCAARIMEESWEMNY